MDRRGIHACRPLRGWISDAPNVPFLSAKFSLVDSLSRGSSRPRKRSPPPGSYPYSPFSIAPFVVGIEPSRPTRVSPPLVSLDPSVSMSSLVDGRPRWEGTHPTLGPGISTPFLLHHLTKGVRIPDRPSVSVRSEKPGGDVSDPSHPLLLFSSNPPHSLGSDELPPCLSLLSHSGVSLLHVSLVGGHRTCVSLSLSLSFFLSFFLSLHPSVRRTKTKEGSERRKVESQGGNLCGSIEKRAGAWVDHTHDAPAWDPSEKKRERGRKEGRRMEPNPKDVA